MALPQVITLTSTLLIDSLTTFCAFFCSLATFLFRVRNLSLHYVLKKLEQVYTKVVGVHNIFVVIKILFRLNSSIHNT